MASFASDHVVFLVHQFFRAELICSLSQDPTFFSHSFFSISLISLGGSESSWDKEKLQSPPSSGAQHGLAHAGLSGSHLTSLQQSHLLANREFFIHTLIFFVCVPFIYVFSSLNPDSSGIEP